MLSRGEDVMSWRSLDRAGIFQAGCLRWIARVVLLCWIGVICQVQAADEPIVVVLSWDGLRHDYMDRDNFPGLSRLAEEGVRANRLKPVVPSNTFPGHVSMATGTYPDRHGIVDNVFVDSERGLYRYAADANWIEAEPMWIASERQGVPTATYFWVGSESDWHGQGVSYRIAPFDGDRPEAEKVDQILHWLSLPNPEKPRLVMSYWAGADSVGHDFGPESDRVVDQLHAQDEQLVRLLEGIDFLDLWARTTLMVVSDHGMAVVNKILDLENLLKTEGIEAGVLGSAVAQIHVHDPAQVAAAGKILAKNIAGIPGAGLHRGGQLPEELRLEHPTRTGDWVVLVPPPYSVYKPAGFQGQAQVWLHALGWDSGSHGFDPDLAEMGGTFLAMGQGVPDGLELDEVRQVDLAATVARLLNIEPPRHSEGRPMW